MSWMRNTFIFFCFSLSSLLVAEEPIEIPYAFKGVHFLVSYSDCDKKALEDVGALCAAMDQAVEHSGATILDSSKWVFPPNGLTMVYLLSESHASIHTYPEHGACFVDLFTCGDHCSSDKFDAALRAYLKPGRVHHRLLTRTEEIQEKE
jgi:S-adenosylmethionine decarboxylase